MEPIVQGSMLRVQLFGCSLVLLFNCSILSVQEFIPIQVQYPINKHHKAANYYFDVLVYYLTEN